MALRFEWDAHKADANLAKHGVSFEEATIVFRDPFSATISDPDHSETEFRFVDLGLSSRGRLRGIVRRASRVYQDHQCSPGDRP